MVCYVTGILSLKKLFYTKLFTNTESVSKTDCNLPLKVN